MKLLRTAEQRLRHARDEMLDPERQQQVRDEWERSGWRSHVTTTLRCVVHTGALRAYAATPQATRVPINKHGVSYGASERMLIGDLLARVQLPAADAQLGTIEVRYWYGRCGTALVDAGLVSTSREMAVPTDWVCDPFNLPKKLRGIAFGSFDDVDDSGAHPHARLNMIEPGTHIVRRFLEATNRDRVLYDMGETFFPAETRAEGRARVKSLFASIDMDGNVRTWAGRWGLNVDDVMQYTVALSGGEVFQFATYIQAQKEATTWLRDKLEHTTGMASYVETWFGSGSARATPRRDSTLVISPQALDRTDCFARHVRRRPREPFGDG